MTELVQLQREDGIVVLEMRLVDNPQRTPIAYTVHNSAVSHSHVHFGETALQACALYNEQKQSWAIVTGLCIVVGVNVTSGELVDIGNTYFEQRYHKANTSEIAAYKRAEALTMLQRSCLYTRQTDYMATPRRTIVERNITLQKQSKEAMQNAGFTKNQHLVAQALFNGNSSMPPEEVEEAIKLF